MDNYMGVFVEIEEDQKQKMEAIYKGSGCQHCKFKDEVDRHECNECARIWNESGYTKYVGWQMRSK